MPVHPRTDFGVRAPRHHWIVYVLLALFGGLITFAGAMAEQKATDESTFRKLTDSYCAAWSSGNFATISKFYSQDNSQIFYDVAPFSYTGWKEYQAGAQKLFLEGAENVSLTATKDLKVTRHGNIAWTTVPLHLSEKTKEGKMVDMNLRYTGIWEKKGKNWIIVHEHISAPLQ